MTLEVKTIPTGKWKENCYIISKNNAAVVIDAGADSDKIIDYIKSNNLEVKAILNTHAHYDHVGAVSDVKEAFGAEFYLHKNDFRLLQQANFYRAIFEGEHIIKIPKIDFDLSEVDFLQFAEISVSIIPTFGHTAGSVSFLIENNLFVGDTIVSKKIGRTDLPSGNSKLIFESIKTILSLPSEIIVYSGHGKPATIGEIQQALQEEAAL